MVSAKWLTFRRREVLGCVEVTGSYISLWIGVWLKTNRNQVSDSQANRKNRTSYKGNKEKGIPSLVLLPTRTYTLEYLMARGAMFMASSGGCGGLWMVVVVWGTIEPVHSRPGQQTILQTGIPSAGRIACFVWGEAGLNETKKRASVQEIGCRQVVVDRTGGPTALMEAAVAA